MDNFIKKILNEFRIYSRHRNKLLKEDNSGDDEWGELESYLSNEFKRTAPLYFNGEIDEENVVVKNMYDYIFLNAFTHDKNSLFWEEITGDPNFLHGINIDNFYYEVGNKLTQMGFTPEKFDAEVDIMFDDPDFDEKYEGENIAFDFEDHFDSPEEVKQSINQISDVNNVKSNQSDNTSSWNNTSKKILTNYIDSNPEVANTLLKKIKKDASDMDLEEIIYWICKSYDASGLMPQITKALNNK